MNGKLRPYVPGIGTDLMDAGNDPQLNLLCRRELLSKIGKFYFDLSKFVINLLPDNIIPDDSELVHIMTAAGMSDNLAMADKCHQVVIDRCLSEKLEEFIEIIRAPRINMISARGQFMLLHPSHFLRHLRQWSHHHQNPPLLTKYLCRPIM